jgi:hypothetical protein
MIEKIILGKVILSGEKVLQHLTSTLISQILRAVFESIRGFSINQRKRVAEIGILNNNT